MDLEKVTFFMVGIVFLILNIIRSRYLKVVYLRLCLHETEEILLQTQLQFNVEGLECKNLCSTLVAN